VVRNVKWRHRVIFLFGSSAPVFHIRFGAEKAMGIAGLSGPPDWERGAPALARYTFDLPQSIIAKHLQ
jgi:hypothetical protein